MDQKSASASKKPIPKKKASVKKENTVKKTASKKEPAKKTSASSKGTVAKKSAPAKKTVQTKTVAKNVPAKKDQLINSEIQTIIKLSRHMQKESNSPTIVILILSDLK